MLARYLLGLGAMATALGPLYVGTRALRRRYLACSDVSLAALVDIVLAIAFAVVAGELLGTIGLLALVPVVVLFAVSGAVAWFLATPRTPVGASEASKPVASLRIGSAPDRTGRLGAWVALTSVALVVAEWTTQTADSFRYGMSTADTLWYHLPIAARFAQSGSTAHIHYVDARSLIPFYPANSELVHALGIVFFRSDILSPLVNLGWLAVALLAAWCAGRQLGVAPLTVTSVAVLLATSQLTRSQAGQSLNDVAGLALILAAAAIILGTTRDSDRSVPGFALACSALAAGLALGTKYTLVIPAISLGVGMVAITARGQRLRRAAIWFGFSALSGGYWYLRNLIVVGNPIPPQRFALGPIELPSLPFPGTESLAKYVFDGRAWREHFIPGVRSAYGPAWWVLFLALVAGFTIGCIFARGRTVRTLAILAGVSFAAFVLSPQVLQVGSTGRLVFFNANLRYVVHALALGGLVLPLAAVPRFERRVVYLLLVAYLGTIAVTQLSPGVWYGYKAVVSHTPRDYVALAVGITIGAGLFVVGAIRITSRSRARVQARRLRPVLAAVVTIVVVVSGGFGVERYYTAHRYEHSLLGPNAEPANALFRWAQSLHDTRIAIVGFTLQYPLYGRDSSNVVQYLAIRHSDRSSALIDDCRTWRRAVNRGRYEYVITTTANFPFPSREVTSWQRWTQSDPAARLVFHRAGLSKVWVHRIVHPMSPGGCPRVRAARR